MFQASFFKKTDWGKDQDRTIVPAPPSPMAHPMYHPVAILSGDKEIVLLTVPIKNVCINGVVANHFTRKHVHGPSKNPKDDNTALRESTH